MILGTVKTRPGRGESLVWRDARAMGAVNTAYFPHVTQGLRRAWRVAEWNWLMATVHVLALTLAPRRLLCSEAAAQGICPCCLPLKLKRWRKLLGIIFDVRRLPWLHHFLA